VLPTLIFGLVEVRRLQRELETVADYFDAQKLRPAAAQTPPPKISRMLDSLARENHIELQHAVQRQVLLNFLRDVTATAPSVHISFAADPSSALTAKVVAWLRGNIHPLTLLQLGLQPSIAAGCTVRTPNHLFDFSLRQHFSDQRAGLVQAIKEQAKA
jgi:F0F1-type ATP synthase delta subunit